MNKLKWGILGPGRIAREFAADFKWTKLAECVAVASRSKERADQFSRDFGISKSYDSYDALFLDENVQAIYVATPHTFHKEQVIAALQSGKHVLCEKPITTNKADLEEIIEVANQEQRYFIEGMWTYFLPAIQKAKRWVDEGRLGDVLHIKSEFGYSVPFDAKGRMYNPALSGGALWDMGIYNIAMAQLFLGASFENLWVDSSLASSGVDNDVVTHYRVGNAQAHLHTSFKCKLPNKTIIIGEKGYIEIPNFWRASECSFYAEEKLVEIFKDHREGNGFEFEIDKVSEEIMKGELTSNIVSPKASLHFQSLMDEIRATF
ncbi:MAG: putative dehydrogenase [Cyclobacteriaceae bacterium]|jgi:predicted dehydrogenase